MNTTPPPSPLIKYIETTHPEYYGKICELRQAIEGWLTYVPQTFPHYTMHTIGHSDAIVSQISNLLFPDEEPTKPVVNLSGVEAYILVAAAYLHDAGMVVSDKEKGEILTSEAWEKWTTGAGEQAARWKDIQDLRDGINPDPSSPVSDASTRNFLADIQTRFLIAEFIRRQHHFRAATIIELHHEQLGRIDFGDYMLREAIAQVCIGHGLRQHQLDDNARFPTLRDIRGEKVNLRFLAILLRLGDLLDMSVDRACPLLVSAASPLPPDSFPHWRQYQGAIKHRATSTKTIEVGAKCPDQEVHRVLRDWCQWIVDEVNNARIVVPKFQRHANWQIPDATIDVDNPTIKIEPDDNATYRPSNWVLRFDQQAIFERLSDSLYSNPLHFVRELIQNGLDAVRCRMYLDLAKDGQVIPEYPTQASEEIRNRYEVKISISTREIPEPMSGKMETKQVLVIEDNGIGMDIDVIEKYFLQVGRSYYTSDEFRRSFRFHPTSRFGIGFLSVFSVSDNVTVDTFKPSSNAQNNEALRIRLTGFRNYLLREKSLRQGAGTSIEIVLRNEIEPGEITAAVNDWCKRVEFPIFVDDFGEKTTVVAEKPEMFVYEQQLVTDSNAKFAMRAFPVDRPGIEGELYVFAYIDDEGESWAHLDWAQYTYPKLHPLAESPVFVDNLKCIQGIVMENNFKYFRREGRKMSRIDYRGNKFIPTLARDDIRSKRNESSLENELSSRWAEILNEHLSISPRAQTENGWRYKQELMDSIPFPEFWKQVPSTIQVYFGDGPKLLSLNELLQFDKVFVIGTGHNLTEEKKYVLKSVSRLNIASPVITDTDLGHVDANFKYSIFKNRTVTHFDRSPDNYGVLTWTQQKDFQSDANKVWADRFLPLHFDDPDFIALNIGRVMNTNNEIFVNIDHPFVVWINNVLEASSKKELKTQLAEKLRVHLIRAIEYNNFEQLQKFVLDWREISDLSNDLQPPEIELTQDMFKLSKGKAYTGRAAE